MKKKKTIITSLIVLALAVVGTIFAFKPGASSIAISETDTQVNAEGKRCTYTVGCSCTGFKPITDGAEWEKAYCKRCGHHKKYHH